MKPRSRTRCPPEAWLSAGGASQVFYVCTESRVTTTRPSRVFKDKELEDCEGCKKVPRVSRSQQLDRMR